MSKRLLLINDRRSIARTIRSVAPELDLEIVALDNVTRAAARVTELQPDVVVLDVGVAAHELIELLRNIVQTGTTAKIVITTRGDDPTARMTEGLARFHNRRAPVLPARALSPQENQRFPAGPTPQRRFIGGVHR
jgi:DNA-binding NtrC family response regulator